jgi:hypothetical protein
VLQRLVWLRKDLEVAMQRDVDKAVNEMEIRIRRRLVDSTQVRDSNIRIL